MAILLLLFASNKVEVWTYKQVENRLRSKGVLLSSEEINIITNKANYYISYNGQDKELALETALAEFNIF